MDAESTSPTLAQKQAAGRVAFDLGDFDEAIEAARAILAEAPADTTAQTLLVKSLVKAKHPKEAREAARAWAKSIGRSDAEAQRAIGELGFDLRDWNIAEDGYRRALAIDPSHAIVLHNLGSVFRRSLREDDGALATRTAIRLKPELGRALEARAQAHRAEYESAVEARGSASTDSGGSPAAGILAVVGGLAGIGKGLRRSHNEEGSALVMAALILLVVGGVIYTAMIPLRRRWAEERKLPNLDAQVVAIYRSVKAGQKPQPNPALLEKLLGG